MRVGITCTNASLLILMMFDYFENRSLIGGIWVNLVNLCGKVYLFPVRLMDEYK